MTLDGLRCFCAVVEAGGFHAAAVQVFRSQPAVSQQVKALERELAQVLYDRRAGRPTPAGQLVYDGARAVLLGADQLLRSAADLGEGGELRVGTSDTTALYVLPPHVRAFAAALPRVRLVLVHRGSEAIAEQVARGELDLGIVTLPVGRADLSVQTLHDQELVLVLPEAHALAQAERVRLPDLAEEPLLLLNAQTRTGDLLRAHFRKRAFHPQVVLDSGSFEVMKRYVAEGVGLSIMPRVVVGGEDQGLATAEVPGLPKVTIGAVWRKGAYRSRAAETFLGLLEGESADGVSSR